MQVPSVPPLRPVRYVSPPLRSCEETIPRGSHMALRYTLGYVVRVVSSFSYSFNARHPEGPSNELKSGWKIRLDYRRMHRYSAERAAENQA